MGDNQDRQHGPFICCLTVALILLPVVYVLGFGPARWLGNNGYLGDEVKIVYVPLCLFAEYCPPVEGALQWYVELWRGT